MKKAKRVINYLLLIPFILISCTRSETRNNEPIDIETGQKYARTFYQFVMNRNFNDGAKCFSKEFTREKGMEILLRVDSIMGTLKKVEYVKSNTVVNATNGEKSGTYRFIYKAQYEKGKTLEEIAIKSNNDDWKLITYKIGHSME